MPACWSWNLKLNYRAAGVDARRLILQDRRGRSGVSCRRTSSRDLPADGPLRTVHALENRVADSNWIKLPPLCSLKLTGIDKVTGVMRLATESSGKLRRVFAGRRPGARHGPHNGKEFRAVRQFGSLQQQLSGVRKALWTSQRRQVPPFLAHCMTTAANRLEILPASATRRKKNGPAHPALSGWSDGGKPFQSWRRAGVLEDQGHTEGHARPRGSCYRHHHCRRELDGKRSSEQGSRAVIPQLVGLD